MTTPAEAAAKEIVQEIHRNMAINAPNIAAIISRQLPEPESPILAFEKWAKRWCADTGRKFSPEEYFVAQAAFYAAHPGEGPRSVTADARHLPEDKTLSEQEKDTSLSESRVVQDSSEKADLSKLRSRLIHLAAALVTARDFLSPCADDHIKTTPRSVLKIADKQRERLRLWGIEARAIADALPTTQDASGPQLNNVPTERVLQHLPTIPADIDTCPNCGVVISKAED